MTFLIRSVIQFYETFKLWAQNAKPIARHKIKIPKSFSQIGLKSSLSYADSSSELRSVIYAS